MTGSPACPAPTPGGVVEWLMAPVLKTGEVKASAGSNPAPSVFTYVAFRRHPIGLRGTGEGFGSISSKSPSSP